MSEDNITPKEVKAMQVRSLQFSRVDYYHPEKGFQAKAELCKGEGYSTTMTTLNFSLDSKMSNEIMRVLAPIMAREAAVEAQRLADESKALANALSDKLIEQSSMETPQE